MLNDSPRQIQIRVRTKPDPAHPLDPAQGFDTEVVGIDEFGNEYPIPATRVEYVAQAGKAVNVAKIWVAAHIDAQAVVTEVAEAPPEKLALGAYDGDTAHFADRYARYGDLYKRKKRYS